MSLLNPTLDQMSQSDIVQLIQQQIALQIPAIPTGVLNLSDSDVPITISPVTSAQVAQNQAIVWDSDTQAWVASDSVNVALTVPDGSIGDSKLTDMSASKLTAGVIDASVIAMQTAGSGVRLVLDTTGLNMYGPAVGGVYPTTVHIPSDGSTSTFSGQINAGALSVSTGAVINGASGLSIEPNSQINMIGGQSDPNIAPVATGTYARGITISFTDPSGSHRTCVGSRVSHHVGSRYYGSADYLDPSTSLYYSYAMEWNDSTGAVTNHAALYTGATSQGVSFGSCLIGTNVVAFYIGTSGDLTMKNFTTSGWTLVGGTITPGINFSSSVFLTSLVAAVGCDGTNPYMFSFNENTSFPTQVKWTMSGGVATGGGVGSTFSGATSVQQFTNALGSSYQPYDLVGAAWDGSANWYLIFSMEDSGSHFAGRLLQVFAESTKTVVTKQETFWSTAYSNIGGGAAFDGTNFQLFPGSGVTSTSLEFALTGITWDYTLGSIWNFGYEWWDTVNTYNTGVSPVGSLSCASGMTEAPLMRQIITVNLPPLPTLANENIVYALPSTSVVAGSTLKLQSATTHVSSNTAQAITFLLYDSSGANPTASNYQHGGTPAKISGAATGATTTWVADSSGLLRLPTRTTSQRTTGAGDIALSTAFTASGEGVVEVYDGNGILSLVNAHDSEDLYDKLQEMAVANSTFTAASGYPFAYTADPDTLSLINSQAGRLSGGVFMVKRTQVTTGAGIFVTTVSSGTVSGWEGFNLWSIAANGDMTFIDDIGSSTVNTISTSLGWRTAAWTGTHTLIPGTLYAVTVTFATRGTQQAVIAGCNPGLVINGPGSAPFWRSGGKTAAVTTRQNANIVAASQSAYAALPYIGLY